MLQLFWVGLGAGIGAGLRFLVATYVNHLLPSVVLFHEKIRIPFGMVLVNTIGCFLTGFLLESPILQDPIMKLFLTVGFLGGLTSFSSFSLEATTLLKKKHYLAFTGYILFQLVLTLIAIYLGMKAYAL